MADGQPSEPCQERLTSPDRCQQSSLNVDSRPQVAEAIRDSNPISNDSASHDCEAMEADPHMNPPGSPSEPSGVRFHSPREPEKLRKDTRSSSRSNWLHSPWHSSKQLLKATSSISRHVSVDRLQEIERSWMDWAFRVKLPPWFRRHVTFYRLHVACFIVVILISTIILYLIPSGPSGKMSFIDTLYSATSATCLTGMISVDVNVFSDGGNVLRLLLMIIGSQITTSLVPVYVRRFFFHRYLYREGYVTRGGRRSDPAKVAIRSGERGEAEARGKGDGGEGLGVLREERLRACGSGEEREVEARTDLTPDSKAEGPGAAAEVRGKLAHVYSEHAKVSPISSNSNSKRRDGALVIPVKDAPAAADADDARLDSSQNGPRSARADVDALRLDSSQHGPRSVRGEGERRMWDSPGGAQVRTTWTPRRAFGLEDALERTVGPLAHRHAGGEENSWHTWSGDVARAEGQRLKLALEILKVQQQQREAEQRTGSVFLQRTLSSSTLRSDDMEGGSAAGGDVELLPADPGERRFLELRALETLSWLVPVYSVVIQGVAVVLMLIIVHASPAVRQVVDSNGVNSIFFSVFQVVSAFSNTGLVLLNNNLVDFNTNVPLLLLLSGLILLGNTLFAPTLRGLLLLLHWRAKGEHKVVYKYLLDHPRKCYTHLFPRSSTIWLVLTVIAFNTFEFAFFAILDWNSTALNGLSSGAKVLVGYFQSICTRTAGNNVIILALLSPPMLVLYIAMMNVAVYPVYLTRQTSREQREVYGEEDIGVFYEDLQEGVLDAGVLTQGKKLFLHDTALIFFAIFLVCIMESSSISSDPSNFSIFNIIFEIMSGYGNVGFSLGYTCPEDASPDCVSPPYSFSGVWRNESKFVMVLVMLLARHRGLPDNIDAAIVIPDQKQFQSAAKAHEAAAAEREDVESIRSARRAGGRGAVIPPKVMRRANSSNQIIVGGSSSSTSMGASDHPTSRAIGRTP